MRDTTIEAYNSLSDKLPNLTEMVYAVIKKENGCTCWEIEKMMHLRHQTASSRVSALNKEGRIVDSGERRITESGRKAIVWRVKGGTYNGNSN